MPGTLSVAMLAEQPRVRVSIESRHEQIEAVQVVIDDALARVGLDDDFRYRVGISVGEALANAITHGNRQHPEKRVEVELAIADTEAVIRILDQGDGLDVQSVGDPTAPDNLLRPDGRGIFLMRSFMDEVEHSSQAAASTAVTLRKRFTQARTDPHIPKERP